MVIFADGKAFSKEDLRAPAYGWINPPICENPAVRLSPKHKMWMGFAMIMIIG